MSLDGYYGVDALEGAVVGGYALIEEELCGWWGVGEDGDGGVVA